MNVISIVSYSFLPAKTGGQKGIALFYKYFSRFHTVTVVTIEKNDVSRAEGYDVLNILSNSSYRYFNPFLFFKLRKLIQEKKTTRIIIEHPYYGWLGYLLKTFTGVDLVVHSHNMEGKRWKSLGKWWWRILWKYERFTHRRADFNFFIQDEDRKYAITEFGLDEKKCITVGFGTEISSSPSSDQKQAASNNIRKQWQIPAQTPLLLFNGAFGYAPNREALDNLIYRINPILQGKGLSYQILVIGLDIPPFVQETSYPDLLVLGFVENLELYLTGCDVFLNPVRSGGGIKTKLVEALAYGLNAVSTANGAIGVDPKICRGKLFVAPDHNWSLFCEAIIRAIDLKMTMPEDFYHQFFWENITRRAASFIEVPK